MGRRGASIAGIHLLVHAGERRLALPIASVVEVMRPPRIEAMAGVPESVRGVALVRGRPTPVLDPDRLLGGRGLDAARRLVIVRVDGDRAVGLLASDVPGVVDGLGSAELPPLFAGEQVGLDAIAGLDGSLAAVLSTARLVPDDAWPQLPRSDG